LKHPELKDAFLLKSNNFEAWDFGDNDNDVSFDGRNYCRKSHGTKVAGIIAARINKKGLNGVSPTANIFPIKWWPKNYENYFNCADADTNILVPDSAIAYSVILSMQAKADVINLSLGGNHTESSSKNYKKTPTYRAIKIAMEKDIIIVAAMGNDSIEAHTYFPAAIPGVIAVGAINSKDARADFSNYWLDSKGVKENILVAPGKTIYTTRARSMLDKLYSDNYEKANGTSMAAPFVSGLAALLKQIDPTQSATEIKELIVESADDLEVLTPDNKKIVVKVINAETAVRDLVRELKEKNKKLVDENGDKNIETGKSHIETIKDIPNKVTKAIESVAGNVKDLSDTLKNKITDSVENKKQEVAQKIEGKVEKEVESFLTKLEKEIESACTVEAAYASETGEDLDTLRKFRDEVLNKSETGSLFVRKYYKHSPPIAIYLTKHPNIGTFTREIFIKPMVFTIKLLD
ncbi:MAG: S8 family serine peptidase, partial [Candidatus Pacebacteria bacterium]|nr:S8 family serine peptidase [Candidatus Paceibacterota bacterium]